MYSGLVSCGPCTHIDFEKKSNKKYLSKASELSMKSPVIFVNKSAASLHYAHTAWRSVIAHRSSCVYGYECVCTHACGLHASMLSRTRRKLGDKLTIVPIPSKLGDKLTIVPIPSCHPSFLKLPKSGSESIALFVLCGRQGDL